MNQLFLMLGLETWKPLITAMLLPPVPFLLVMLIGARLLFRRRGLGWSMLLLGCMGIWMSSTMFMAELLQRLLMPPVRALAPQELVSLKRSKDSPRTVIVVLGGGRDLYAPEYGMSNLTVIGMERLRYGLWLARETGQPVAFSGGLSPGAPEGPSEAEIATRIAEAEFGRKLHWAEGESRDTGENAARSVRILANEGVQRLVLVTHDYHMARSIRAFERAQAAAGMRLHVIPAPVGLAARIPNQLLAFVPTHQGAYKTRLVLREFLGILSGA
ncbi:MAG TPA: YdcF family protein [Rubrivivax sp.]|jgi:uncharacterized SAM-binding protein YcdF (DUF218 family)|nr:YdcF family protein [Rubrivivax sp.]